MWYPASQSVGGEQERQLRRVHKTTPSGAKKPCELNEGGPFVVRSCTGPWVPFPETLTPVLATPAQEARLSDFRWHPLKSEKLLKGGESLSLREMYITYFLCLQFEDYRP